MLSEKDIKLVTRLTKEFKKYKELQQFNLSQTNADNLAMEKAEQDKHYAKQKTPTSSAAEYASQKASLSPKEKYEKNQAFKASQKELHRLNIKKFKSLARKAKKNYLFVNSNREYFDDVLSIIDFYEENYFHFSKVVITEILLMETLDCDDDEVWVVYRSSDEFL
jgi:hypothetical protein